MFSCTRQTLLQRDGKNVSATFWKTHINRSRKMFAPLSGNPCGELRYLTPLCILVCVLDSYYQGKLTSISSKDKSPSSEEAYSKSRLSFAKMQMIDRFREF